MSALPAQLALFDYATLDSETRIVVQQRTTEIKGLMRRTAEAVIEMGAKFSEVRQLLRHNKAGGFELWLETEGFGRRTAYNCIAVHERFGNRADFAQLDVAASALMLLAAPSTPDSAREEALDRAAAGEPISFTAARELVEAHKTPAPVAGPSHIEVIPFAPSYDDGLDDEPLDAFEQQVAARYVAPDPARESHQLINASTSNEWYTPAEFVQAAREVMGQIDLDPASCEFANRTVGAERFYTIDDDGMAQPWSGCLWLNPPYGRDEGQLDSNQARWSRRLIDEYRAGKVREAVLLVNAVPGNRWFAPLKDFPICFPDARIRFYNEETAAGQPTHSNALVYFGPDVARFVRVFSQFGRVMAPLTTDGDDLYIDL